MDKEKIEKIIYELILALGENPERDGLKETPKRVTKMFEEFCCKDDKNLVKIFEEKSESIEYIEIKDIHFCSLCEHHLMPFFGVVHIKYIPNPSYVVGISKFARIVKYFSRGLQIQERITNKIANFIFEKLKVLGVEVIIEAEHSCMTMRGANSRNSITKTVVKKGALIK